MLEESLCRVNVMTPNTFTFFFPPNAHKGAGSLVLKSDLLCFSTEWAATTVPAHRTGSIVSPALPLPQPLCSHAAANRRESEDELGV